MKQDRRREGRPITVQSARSRSVMLALFKEQIRSVDGLWALTRAASNGALVVATMAADNHPYSRLVDLICLAEDWSGSFRRDFDAVLYAVIHREPASGREQPEAQIHLGPRLSYPS